MNMAPFNESGLYPYQVDNAIRICNALVEHGAVLDGSDTGSGKTFTICAVARHRNEAPLVVAPKAVLSAWKRAADQLGGKVHVTNYEALKGTSEWGRLSKPDGYAEASRDARELKAAVETFRTNMRAVDVKMTNPDLTQEQRRALRDEWKLVDFNALLLREDKAKKLLKELKRQRRFEWYPGPPFIVFDEVQRAKAPDSLNAKLLIAARRQGFPVVLASATAAQSPLEMRAIGYALSLHDGVDFWPWCRRNGCKPSSFGGFKFVGGDPVMKRIHAQIFPEKGVRTRREDIPNFPESHITAELYDLEGSAHIDELYAQMGAALEALKVQQKDDVDLDHPLTQMLRARQEVELIKVPLFDELAQDAVAEGMSVAIFVNFDQTIKELQQRFETASIPASLIVGGQTTAERDEQIAQFQNSGTRVILANLKAGGVGVSLHDLDGKHPRLALISPTFSALDLVQVLGRVWRQGGKSKSIQRIVLAAGTVEQHVQSRIANKLANISLLNDGDLNPLIK